MNMFDMDKEKAKFESRFRIIKALVALIFLLVLAGGVSLIYLAMRATQHVEKHGLKSVVEEVWNGKDQSLPSSANTQQ
jgi:ABC-type phosphate transport system permease subunit